jgi:hypothetical protein
MVHAAIQYASADFDQGIEEWFPAAPTGRGFVASLKEGLNPAKTLDKGKFVEAMEAGLGQLAQMATDVRQQVIEDRHRKR